MKKINTKQLQEAINAYNSYPQNSGIHPVIWINTETGDAWESPVIGENWRNTSEHIIMVDINCIYRYGEITASNIMTWYAYNAY